MGVGGLDCLHVEVAPQRPQDLGRVSRMVLDPGPGFLQLLVNEFEHLRMCFCVSSAGQVVALVAGQAAAVGQGPRRQLTLHTAEKGFPGDPGVNLLIFERRPKTESVAPVEQKDPLVVSIDDKGKVFINKDEIQADLLESNLQAVKAKNPDVRVQLQADNGVNYGEVARAMASIERAGISKLSVITAK